MSIAMKPVTSTQLAAVGYDPESKTMAVQFHPSKSRGEAEGPVYHYTGVEQDDHDKLVGAESVGKHFAAHVKFSFPYEKQERRDTEQQEGRAASEGL